MLMFNEFEIANFVSVLDSVDLVNDGIQSDLAL